jgi:hypothetical protein
MLFDKKSYLLFKGDVSDATQSDREFKEEESGGNFFL